MGSRTIGNFDILVPDLIGPMTEGFHWRLASSLPQGYSLGLSNALPILLVDARKQGYQPFMPA